MLPILHPCLAVSIYITWQLDLILVCTTPWLPFSATYWSSGKPRQVKITQKETKTKNPFRNERRKCGDGYTFASFYFSSTNLKIDRKVVKVTDGHGHEHRENEQFSRFNFPPSPFQGTKTMKRLKRHFSDTNIRTSR
jgi:hypothetical protein